MRSPQGVRPDLPREIRVCHEMERRASRSRCHKADPLVMMLPREPHCLGAEPLEDRYAAQDNSPAAAFLPEAAYQFFTGSCRFGLFRDPGFHLARKLASERPVAIDPAQGAKMPATGFFANRIRQQFIRFQVQPVHNDSRQLHPERKRRTSHRTRKLARQPLTLHSSGTYPGKPTTSFAVATPCAVECPRSDCPQTGRSVNGKENRKEFLEIPFFSGLCSLSRAGAVSEVSLERLGGLSA